MRDVFVSGVIGFLFTSPEFSGFDVLPALGFALFVMQPCAENEKAYKDGWDWYIAKHFIRPFSI